MRSVVLQSNAQNDPARKQPKRTPPLVPIQPVSATVGPLAQRKANCACGGDCPRCEKESLSPDIQTKLAISTPGDQYEQEADRVAERVMRMPDPQVAPEATAPAYGSSLQLHRKRRSGETEQRELALTETDETLQPKEQPGQAGPAARFAETSTPVTSSAGDGEPLSESSRAFFEPRFKHDFSKVRVHADGPAAESARAVQAKAYTFEPDIVFASGQFAPETESGKFLLAHELAHFIQQGQGGPAGGMLMRRWDAAPECSIEPQNKWIQRIVVDQATPQSVTVHWSDGTTESDQCSTGKGHCCVAAGSAEGGTCSEAGSRMNGSNCTPVTTGTGIPVVNRVLDHHGVAFWTEIDSVRAIALHAYTPVDGTPLSHGCIRLNRAMAIKIFCGSKRSGQQQTIVQISNLARPMCETASLQQEWRGDFSNGGSDLSQYDGDRDRQAVIRQTRIELNAAFGRSLTVDQIRSLTVADIPRCRIATVEEATAAPGSRSSPSVPAQILSAGGFAAAPARFTQALARAADLAGARSIVAQHAADLWQAATARAQGSTPDTDDRPLYWARLQMMQALRFWTPSFLMPFSQRATLLTLFEQTARGMQSATFTAAPGEKRILISGFDPFQLTTSMVRGNPSGAAVLSLDGRRLTAGTVTAEVQGVIFPVRFADFDAGAVESFFSPYLASPNPVDMIMTISQGGSTEFEAEQFAGRRRGTSSPDNLNATGGPSSAPTAVPAGLAAGPEFIETTLPVSQIRSAVGRTTPITGETEVTEVPAGGTAPSNIPSGGPTPGSTSVSGSGGNYLSNEIFYRISLLRLQSQTANPDRRTIPVGHLHTPYLAPSATGISDPQFVAAREAIDRQVEQILRATLPTL